MSMPGGDSMPVAVARRRGGRVGERRRRSSDNPRLQGSGAFRFAHFNDRAHKLLESMAEHFRRAYTEHAAILMDNFDYQNDLRRFFVEALKDHNQKPFRDSRGSLGKACPYPSAPPGGTPDFGEIGTRGGRRLCSVRRRVAQRLPPPASR
jgi:hypothetical protein